MAAVPPRIFLPINFAHIGLNYNMSAVNFHWLDGVNQAHTNMLYANVLQGQPNVVDNLKFNYVGQNQRDNVAVFEFVNDALWSSSRITIQGITYKVIGPLGRGTYGLCAKVERIDNHQRFCLKRQAIYKVDPGLPVAHDVPPTSGERKIEPLKELIVHSVLFQNPQTSDCVPGIYQVALSDNGIFIYYITELMGNTFDTFLKTTPVVVPEPAHGPTFDPLTFVRRLIAFYGQITLKLCKLYSICEYTHGDFKADNIMYNQGNYKLIDFGFSRLKLYSNHAAPVEHVIKISVYNIVESRSRDLTMISKYIHLFFPNEIQAPPPYVNHEVNYVRTFIYILLRNALCRGNIAGHAPHGRDLTLENWDDNFYILFNHHDNAAGGFESIELYLQNYQFNSAAPIPFVPTVEFLNLYQVITNPPGLALLAAPINHCGIHNEADPNYIFNRVPQIGQYRPPIHPPPAAPPAAAGPGFGCILGAAGGAILFALVAYLIPMAAMQQGGRRFEKLKLRKNTRRSSKRKANGSRKNGRRKTRH